MGPPRAVLNVALFALLMALAAVCRADSVVDAAVATTVQELVDDTAGLATVGVTVLLIYVALNGLRWVRRALS